MLLKNSFWIQQILIKENNKSFYPLDMFEFFYYPEYGCCNLKGLNDTNEIKKNNINIMLSTLLFFKE